MSLSKRSLLAPFGPLWWTEIIISLSMGVSLRPKKSTAGGMVCPQCGQRVCGRTRTRCSPI